MVRSAERYLTQYLSSSSESVSSSGSASSSGNSEGSELSLEKELFSPSVTRQGLIPAAGSRGALPAPTSGVAALRVAREALRTKYPGGVRIASGDYGLVDVSSLLVTFVGADAEGDGAAPRAPAFRGACLLAFSPESRKIDRIEDYHHEW